MYNISAASCRTPLIRSLARLAMSSSSADVDRPTAGIIIIGDEILKAQTTDTNSHFIAHRLRKLGIEVKKISVVGDDLEQISQEVGRFSRSFTHVITTGGIGPTHDDCTFEGISAAFEEPLTAHPELVAVINEYFKGDERAAASIKMAQIPASSELLYPCDRVSGYKSKFPVVRVRNVVVLPGVPQLTEKAFALIDLEVFGQHATCSLLNVYLDTDELSITTPLTNTVNKFPHVSIGSYPHMYHSYFKTHLTMESKTMEAVTEAKEHFLSQVDKSIAVDYVLDTLALAWPRLADLMTSQSALGDPVEWALGVLREALKRYTTEELYVCFNGGKDCLVVLHLYYALLQQQCTKDKTENVPAIRALFITEPDSFPEVTKFVDQTINRYGLQCTVLPGPLKSALTTLKQTHPLMKAVIMGSRSTDPHCQSLSSFSPTDGDWPSFMRVNPILSWGYGHVWGVIRGLYLPYCPLYDRGYTSLGNARNTFPNPALSHKDSLGRPSYLPAHLLEGEAKERAGRC